MGICRKPKTTQERRVNGSRCQWLMIDEYCVKCRACRSMCLLPEAWDDVIRGDIKYRSWKHYRKTQYKLK